jgi:hypothetical protein
MVGFFTAPKSYHQPSHPGEVLEQEDLRIATSTKYGIFEKNWSEKHCSKNVLKLPRFMIVR